MSKKIKVEEVEMTHTAWFGICPVLLCEIDDSVPFLHERWAILLPLLIFSEFIAGLIISFQLRKDPEYIPQFPVHHVKELKKPIIKKFKIHGDEN